MLDVTGLPTGAHKSNLVSCIDELIAFIGDSVLDESLELRLQSKFGPQSKFFLETTRLLRLGIEERWACYDVIDGESYRRGRLGNSFDAPHEFAIESARLKNVKGKYHTHTLGEINMIQPLDEAATFCGSGAGWKVFAPGTSHYPSVSDGLCTFIFLLPKGQIEYHNDR